MSVKNTFSPIPVREIKPKRWAVLDNAGMANESFVDDFATFDLANAFIKPRGKGQIMKRLEDGTLTTEY